MNLLENMHKIKFILQGWNSPYGELQSEEDTIDFYRTSYEDEISKKELEENLQSLEKWAACAYKNKLLFHVTALIERNDQPYADITFNEGNVIVEFIDEFNRTYLAYSFHGDVTEGKLFIANLHYFIYDKDEFTIYSKEDARYYFTPEGKVTVYKEFIGEDGQKYKSVEESAHPVNIEKNWEEYPKLGEYDSIVLLKRWDNDDFLKGINLSKYV